MYKVNSSAYKLGLRDGKDAYLLDRERQNPFCPVDEINSYKDYNEAWFIGYQEEQDK